MSIPASAESGPRGPNAVTLPTMSRGCRRRELLVLDAELECQARAHVDEHHVGPGEESVEDLAGVRVLEIERQRVLAAVPDREVPALARRQRRDVTARLALGRLDLDHVSAAVGEHLARPRDGDELPQLDHGDTGERLLVAHRHPYAPALPFWTLAAPTPWWPRECHDCGPAAIPPTRPPSIPHGLISAGGTETVSVARPGCAREGSREAVHQR